MPRPTSHYPPEFRREAVRLYSSSHKSIPEMVEELKISGARGTAPPAPRKQGAQVIESVPPKTYPIALPVESITAFFAWEGGIR